MSTIHEFYSFQTKGYSEMNEMISMCAFKLVWNDKKISMKHLFVRYIPPFEWNKRLLRQKHKLKQRCKCINMCVTIVTKNLNYIL